MKRCPNCKAPSSLLRQAYVPHEARIGRRTFTGDLPAVRCGRCNSVFVHAPNVERFELIVAERLARAGVSSGDAFRFMRKSLGVRAADLATQIGVTPETVSRWEKGRRKVDHAALAVLGRLVVDRVQGRDESRRLLEALRAPKPLARVIHLEEFRRKAVRRVDNIRGPKPASKRRTAVG